jgi:Mrp family chromosome partitioning ATPase
MKDELIIYSKPKGATSEAIRTLRTNLQFSLMDDNKKVIMVTSSIPGEGKSFVSANLAGAFSMVNKKVLLIDCDLRKGRQSKIFNINDDKGLSVLLLDEVSTIRNIFIKHK